MRKPRSTRKRVSYALWYSAERSRVIYFGATAMRFVTLLVGSLLLVVVAVALLVSTPELGDVGGKPHERFSTMASGGSGSARHANVLWLGGFFGAAAIAYYVALMAFGARKDSSLRGLGKPLAASFGVALAFWVWLLVSYARTMDGGAVSFFLTLPGPSAIMLYGLFPVTILFNLLYVIGYNRWILTEEDYQEYKRIVAKIRSRSL